MLNLLALAAFALPLANDPVFEALSPPDGQPGDQFGSRLAVDGTRMVVRASGDDPEGSVYVLQKVGNAWQFEAKLTPEPVQLNSNYGWSVDIEGERIVVGAPREDGVREDQGAVYYYEFVAGQWTLIQRLVSTDPIANGRFGIKVSLSGDELAVSVPGVFQDVPDVHTGQIDVHALVDGLWRSQEKVEIAEDQVSADGFGLQLDGDTMITMFQKWNPVDGVRQSLLIRERSQDGWTVTQELTAPLDDMGTPGSYASEFHFEGDRLLVSSQARWIDGLRNAGTVFAYRRQQGQWALQDILEPPTPWEEHRFGHSLDIDGDRALIGMYAFASFSPDPAEVYVYREKDQRWGLERILSNPVEVGDDRFGAELALLGDDVFVPSFTAAPNGENSGVVYRFEVPSAYESFCSATDTSLGEASKLFFTGAACVDAEDSQFIVRPVPNDFGLVYMGTQMVDLPFGNGRRCVSGEVVRLGVGQAQDQELIVPVDPLALGISAGETKLFQAWFRDVAAAGSGFNLSDAVSISFE